MAEQSPKAPKAAASSAPGNPARHNPEPGPAPRPGWLRVREAARHWRISKAKLYDLMHRGHVRHISLREKGSVRGTRLVSEASLRQYMESRMQGGQEEGGAQA